MDIKILQISAQSPFLDQVIKLGDKYSNFLGFYPHDAFIEDAKHKRIIVALVDGVCVGYLLFRIVRTKNRAAITHLCVDEKHQGMYIGRSLVEHLISITKDWQGISLFCRRDYKSKGFWEHMGFSYKGEKTGRGKDRVQLIHYWFDHNHPNLFSHANETKISSKSFKAIMDMNIFIDLHNNPGHPLKADWLSEDLVICVTPEISTEINRDNNKDRRLSMLDYFETFPNVNSNRTEMCRIFDVFKDYYPLPLSIQDESDLRQISYAVVSGADFFITRDKNVSRKFKKILFSKFGLSIVSDDDLIIYFDKLLNNVMYQSNRLAGSLIKISRVTSEETDIVANSFHQTALEKKGKFREKLSRFLSFPQSYETLLVTSQNNDLLALLVLSKENNGKIEIPIFRTKNCPLSPDLESKLLFWSVTRAAENGAFIIKVIDKNISNNTKVALQENSFIEIADEWIKLNLNGAIGIKEVLAFITNSKNEKIEYSLLLTSLLDEANNINKNQENSKIIAFEKKLWPLKIISPNIDTYLVPIQAKWASDLFDYQLGSQTLFGSDPKLVLKMDNVYYRSSKTKIPTAPSRILWYVSRGSHNQFQGTMAIRACSYVEEVVVGSPKILFKRFANLGVYKWQNLLDAADGDLSKELLSFRFSRTEMFEEPVSLESYKMITGNKCAPQAPQKIDNDIFNKIYLEGFSKMRSHL